MTINGADIADLVPQALARLTAWIGQRPVLFAGSIRDNILFAQSGRDGRRAGRRASAPHASTSSLPRCRMRRLRGRGSARVGYGLSGGQAQRVAIARAFLKNAPLLLLDVPTAYLDPAAESEVLDGLRRLAIGRTVVMAAHSTAAQSVRGQRVDIRDGRAVRARGVA